MPVAQSQIAEVLGVVAARVPPDQLEAVLLDLRETLAYRRNVSFQKTVDRLLEALWQKKTS